MTLLIDVAELRRRQRRANPMARASSMDSLDELFAAALAARGKAPIIPFFVRREAPGKFYIAFGAPIDAGNGSPAAQFAATQATASAMEQLIRTDPTQWNCFKPLWPNAQEQERLKSRAATMSAEVS